MKNSTSHRLCLISDDFLPAATGVGVHLKVVAPALVRRGHAVSVITTRRAGEAELEHWEGVTIHRVPTLTLFGFPQALPSAATLARLFEAERPDLVHHHYAGVMMRRACAVARRMQLPQLSTYHFGPEVLTQPLPMRPLRGLIRRLMVETNNRLERVLVPSRALAEQLPAAGLRTAVRYLSNPVAFSDEPVEPAARGPGFTVLYAGRLAPEKNLPYLLRAFAQLVRAVPEARLWIAGSGPEAQRVARLTHELGLGERVELLGFLDHAALARRYAACDAFVLPSLEESQDLVAMEAMWFRRPVLVTRAITSGPELVDHGVNGFIVDERSTADLAERLRVLALDPALRATMRTAGRARCEAWRPEVVLDQLEAHYQAVLEERAVTTAPSLVRLVAGRVEAV